MSRNEHALEHYQNPRHRAVFREESNQCGDTIRMAVEVEDGEVKSILWAGEGCCMSMAAASMVAERLTGAEVGEINEVQMVDLFGEIPITRRNCVMLAIRILREMI